MEENVKRYENKLNDPNALPQPQQGQDQGKDRTKPLALETESPPLFIEGNKHSNTMDKVFGELPIQSIQSAEIANKSRSGSDSSHIKPHSSGAHLVGSGSNISLMTTNPSVQYTLNISHYTPRIACVNDGQAWVQTGGFTLQLMDRGGSVRDIINTDFTIHGMAVTSDGYILLSDYNNRCVRSVSRKKIFSTLFSTSGEPFALCCLYNGDIVVAFRGDSKVAVYDRTGQVRKTMDHIKFRRPMSVSVNKVNQNIYICDKECNGLDSAGKVIAVGTDYKLLYEYTGQGDSSFTPVEICTDQMGHILITDFRKPKIHILDQEGQFMQYILTSQGLHHPRTVDVDREGYVWVGEYVNNKGRFTVARYQYSR